MVTQNKGKYHAIEIANYFLFKAQQEGQELLSNLKLQKLIYYAQGLHLAVYGKPLFDEEIKAWQYGPVVPSLYHNYKVFGASGIPADDAFDPSSIDEKTREFLDEIYKFLGQFSALRLMDLAHSDKCWIDAGDGNEITHQAMTDCLKKYVKNA